jgi:hypothetical protein
LNAAVPSRVGSLVDLEEVLVAEATLEPFPVDLWALEVSHQHLEDSEVAVVDSEAASTVAEDEVGSEVAAAAAAEEDSQIEAAMVEEVEVALATEAVSAAPTAPLLQMPQQGQVVAVVVVVLEADTVVDDQAPQDLPIETVLVGMVRVMVAAHMMIEMAATVAPAEATLIAMHLEEAVAAIWSR